MSVFAEALPVADFMPGGDDDGGEKEPMDPRLQKFLSLLVSRKFWLTTISLLVALGLIDATESDIAEFVEAALVVVTGLLMSFNIAIEDGLRGK